MKFVVSCYSSSHGKLKQMPKQLTALSCSKLARPSQPVAGSEGRAHPSTLPWPPWGDPSKAPSGFVCLPGETRHFISGPDMAQLPCKPGTKLGAQKPGSLHNRPRTWAHKSPPWGRGAGRPHLPEAEGLKLITRSLRTKLKWRGFPGGPAVKNSPANAKDRGSVRGLGQLHVPQGN